MYKTFNTSVANYCFKQRELEFLSFDIPLVFECGCWLRGLGPAVALHGINEVPER